LNIEMGKKWGTKAEHWGFPKTTKIGGCAGGKFPEQNFTRVGCNNAEQRGEGGRTKVSGGASNEDSGVLGGVKGSFGHSSRAGAQETFTRSLDWLERGAQNFGGRREDQLWSIYPLSRGESVRMEEGKWVQSSLCWRVEVQKGKSKNG